MKCPYCAAVGQTGVCEFCGNDLENKEKAPVIVNNYYYDRQPEQEYYQSRDDENVSDKRKMTTLVLCILFGASGIHNFYVGKIGKGILYLLTGGLFGIGWIVDIISIATGSFTDANGLLLYDDATTNYMRKRNAPRDRIREARKKANRERRYLILAIICLFCFFTTFDSLGKSTLAFALGLVIFIYLWNKARKGK